VFQGSMKLEGRKNNSSIEESMKLIWITSSPNYILQNQPWGKGLMFHNEVKNGTKVGHVHKSPLGEKMLL
jgi:hypothetical protein